MKVTPINTQVALGAYGVSRQPVSAASAISFKNISVEFSDDAKTCISAAKSVRDMLSESCLQDSRIRNITEQIKAGTYNPATADVAAKAYTSLLGQ